MTHLKSKAYAAVDAPFFIDVAAEAAFDLTVNAGCFADFDVGSQAQLEPGVAVVVMFTQAIVGAAGVRRQLQITLACKFVQQIGFQVDITATCDLLPHNKADTTNGAVHAFDIAVGASVCGVIDAAQSAEGKLCLRFYKEAALHVKPLAVFHADAVGVLLVFGFVGVVAVGFQIRRYHAVAGRDIGVGSLLPVQTP